ncbi:hypothetical protein FQR65_LT08929 [Abscondita terminalis]|nr:hypothetical protein FQR65_LT08929 [Abscondita terminalis]
MSNIKRHQLCWDSVLAQLLYVCLIIDQEEFKFINHNLNVFSNNSYGYVSKYLYLNLQLKLDVPPTTTVVIKVYKKINENLRFTGINVPVTIPEVLRMEAFDMLDLFTNCFKPLLYGHLKKITVTPVVDAPRVSKKLNSYLLLAFRSESEENFQRFRAF